jgi:Zn-finger nucleic acid-binding protein
MLADRQGIEIDYCPKCRGVWLDRGELDKIIERSFSAPPERHREMPPERPREMPPERYREVHRENVVYNAPPPGYHGEQRRHEDHRHHRKRKSFLEDIFDFD